FGGEIAVGPEARGLLRVRMRVDVAALAGESARHRVERDDPDVARSTTRADQLLRDLLALDELPEPVQTGRERHLDLGLRRAEQQRAAAGLDGDRVVVGAARGGRE